MAGKTENGGLRSYASMTYAGLKSMIYAGIGPDDPRTKAAVAGLKKNYALDTNPGMGAPPVCITITNTFAKALDAVGQDEFVDADGKNTTATGNRQGTKEAATAQRFVGQRNQPLCWKEIRISLLATGPPGWGPFLLPPCKEVILHMRPRLNILWSMRRRRKLRPITAN